MSIYASYPGAGGGGPASAIVIGNPVNGGTPWANLYIDGSGNLADGFVLYNASGGQSIDIASTLLLDNLGNNSLQWDSRNFIDSSHNTVLDYQQRLLYNFSGFVGVNWGASRLYNGGGIEVLDWDAQVMFDVSSNYSIDWGARSWFDSAGVNSGNWNSRVLRDNGAVSTLNWQLSFLVSSDGNNPSLDWHYARMFDSSNILSMDWYNRQMRASTGNLSIDYNTHQLFDGSGNLSVSWDGRQLLASDGTTKIIDWSANDRFVFGPAAIAGSIYDIAFGFGSSTQTNTGTSGGAIAIGYNSYTGGANDVALGANISMAGGFVSGNSTAIGPSTSTSSYGNVAVGYATTAQGLQALAFGVYSWANADYASMFGSFTTTHANAVANSMAFGGWNGSSNQTWFNLSQVGANFNNITIVDGNALTSIDPNQRILSNTYGVNVFNWYSNNLPYFYSGIGDNLGFLSIAPSYRQLFASDGTTAQLGWIDPGVIYLGPGSTPVNLMWTVSGNGIIDNNTVMSIDPNNRLLIDASPFHSIDWQNRQLVDVNGAFPSVDWFLHLMNDQGAVLSVNWDVRQLYGTAASFATLDWNNSRLNKNNGFGSAQKSVDWNTQTLWYSASVQALDWSSALLIDQSFSPSVDWTQRFLYDTAGITNTSIDWGNRNLYAAGSTTVSVAYGVYKLNNTVGFSLDWAASTLLNSSGTANLNWSSGVQLPLQTASRVATFDASKNLVSSSVTTSTLAFLDATSSIQTQLNTLTTNLAANLPSTVASGTQTAQTGNVTLCTKTTPASGTYEVGGYIDVTAYTAGVLALQATYNDDTGAAKTLSIPVTSLAGVVAASVGAAGDFSSLSATIRTNGSASIVIKTTGTAFTGTYNGFGYVVRTV